MAKYLILWEVQLSRTPVDPAEKKAQWSGMAGMVAEFMKQGILKDFGEFVGQDEGYMIAEGTEQEIHDMTHKWVPLVKFEARAIASLEVVDKMIQGVA